jgi:RimJ/RimL family protein N-acetyltransferase
MSKWINEIELKSETVTLKPLTINHREDLLKAASDGKLWNLGFTNVPSADTIDAYVDGALTEKKRGTMYPFVVVKNQSGEILGSTRYCNIEPTNKRLEIGYTWYAKRVQRTSVNTECKLMLLTHAFESLEAIAVEFRTHHENLPSQTAIKRLGANPDGVLRNHMIQPDGSLRDTHVFSILASEWPTVKKYLLLRLSA